MKTDNLQEKTKHAPEEAHRHGHRHRRGGFIPRLFRRIIVIALIAVLLLLGWNYYKEKVFDSKSPVTHKNELSDTVVKSRLQEIGELVTYSYEYEDIREIKDAKQLFGYNIPGTTHTIRLSYNGTIKVGYQVADITVSVNNEENIIYVTLPAPEITDNYIDVDNLKYSEQNNIFNPIKGEEITSGLEEIKASELEKAEEKGIYELAAGSAKSAISSLLSDFSGFTVKFT